MNLETLLLVVAAVLAVVFNVVAPRLGKQQKDRPVDATAAEPGPPAAATAVPESVLSGSPSPRSATRRDPSIRAAALAAPVAGRSARRSPLGSLSGMRQGIVLAALLGPCRAQTPFV